MEDTLRRLPYLCCLIQIDSNLRKGLSFSQCPQNRVTAISVDLATYFAIAVPINIDINGPVAADMRS